MPFEIPTTRNVMFNVHGLFISVVLCETAQCLMLVFLAETIF